MAREEMQWLGRKEWLDDRQTNWDNCDTDNVLWKTVMADMTVEVLAQAGMGKAAPAQEARKEERGETARQDGGGLEASQHVGATPDGEPEERELQQQPNPNPNWNCNSNSSLNRKTKPSLSPRPLRPGGGRQSNHEPEPRVRRGPLAHTPPWRLD